MNGREIDFDFAAIAAAAMTAIIFLAEGLAWVVRRLRGMKARKLEEKVSRTYGELPEVLRDMIVSHKWDNMNISQQRDWAIDTLATQAREALELREALEWAANTGVNLWRGASGYVWADMQGGSFDGSTPLEAINNARGKR